MSGRLFGGTLPGAWVIDGACAKTDPETFFPEVGRSPRPAKDVCATCPVIFDCLEYALANNESGVWGGTSENERLRIKKERRVA